MVHLLLGRILLKRIKFNCDFIFKFGHKNRLYVLNSRISMEQWKLVVFKKYLPDSHLWNKHKYNETMFTLVKET